MNGKYTNNKKKKTISFITKKLNLIIITILYIFIVLFIYI